MKKNRKRFATVLLSCQVTAMILPSINAMAHELDEGNPTPITHTLEETEIPEDTVTTEVAVDEIESAGPTESEPTPIQPETPDQEPGGSTPLQPEDPKPIEPEPVMPDEKPSEPQLPQQPSDKPSLNVVPAEKEEPKTEMPKVEFPKVDVPAAEVVEPTVSHEIKETESKIASVADKGYVGNLKKAMKLDDFKTANLTSFLGNGNPFMVGQCTWFAWARFYQVYGFDSGARGNGKTNAREIVAAHGDKFELSSTPAAGATFSMERNTLMPQYGHVGFVEAFDGEYVWISEGNVMFNGRGGNIWVHKVRWDEFKATYPDIVFAIPKKGVCDLEEETSTQKKITLRRSQNELTTTKKVTLKRASRKKYLHRQTVIEK